MSDRCDAAIYITDEQLHRLAAHAGELVVSCMQFGSFPDVGIPKGLRANCPECGRKDVLVRPFCVGGGTSGGSTIWAYALRSHLAEVNA